MTTACWPHCNGGLQMLTFGKKGSWIDFLTKTFHPSRVRECGRLRLPAAAKVLRHLPPAAAGPGGRIGPRRPRWPLVGSRLLQQRSGLGKPESSSEASNFRKPPERQERSFRKEPGGWVRNRKCSSYWKNESGKFRSGQQGWKTGTGTGTGTFNHPPSGAVFDEKFIDQVKHFSTDSSIQAGFVQKGEKQH